MTTIQASYPNTECPDCSWAIPADAVDGSACENCGHVFNVSAPAILAENAQHTPGPWIYGAENLGNGRWFVGHERWHEKQDGTDHVCIVEARTNAEADAALIASAPALLSENTQLRQRVQELEGALRPLIAMYADVAPYGQSPVVQAARAALERGPQ